MAADEARVQQAHSNANIVVMEHTSLAMTVLLTEKYVSNVGAATTSSQFVKAA